MPLQTIEERIAIVMKGPVMPARGHARLAATPGFLPLPARGHARLPATPGSRPLPASCPAGSRPLPASCPAGFLPCRLPATPGSQNMPFSGRICPIFGIPENKFDFSPLQSILELKRETNNEAKGNDYGQLCHFRRFWRDYYSERS
jgi:hypothetical protein